MIDTCSEQNNELRITVVVCKLAVKRKQYDTVEVTSQTDLQFKDRKEVNPKINVDLCHLLTKPFVTEIPFAFDRVLSEKDDRYDSV